VTANATSGFDYAVYECRDSEKLAGSITADYVNTGIALQGVAASWNYVKEFAATKLGVMFPSLFGGSTSGWYKSAFYGAASAGVRCPWRFGYLGCGGLAGLACGGGYGAPAAAGWFGVPRLCGSGKKRGEWLG
jgi:hypothetical protein